jgi:hypothetical protein
LVSEGRPIYVTVTVNVGPGPAVIEEPAHTVIATGLVVAVWPARLGGTPVAPP